MYKYLAELNDLIFNGKMEYADAFFRVVFSNKLNEEQAQELEYEYDNQGV
jgi:hypothetical protein